MSVRLFVPLIDEAVQVIRESVKRNFVEYSVETVDGDVENFSNPPWNLSSEGLQGHPCLVDVGGRHNLQYPTLHDRAYQLEEVADAIGRKGSYILGACAASSRVIGKNGELVPNVNLTTGIRKTRTAYLEADEQTPIYSDYDSNLIGGLANLYFSDGKREGKLIKVHAKNRSGPQDFIECVRQGLTDRYSNEGKTVGLGGVFLIVEGSIKSHIMPGFCCDRIMDHDFMVNDWLRYYTIDAPLVCQSTILSDHLGKGYILEHTHFKSNHANGHYHYDTTPESVEYLGYFVICEEFHKVFPSSEPT